MKALVPFAMLAGFLGPSVVAILWIRLRPNRQGFRAGRAIGIFKLLSTSFAAAACVAWMSMPSPVSRLYPDQVQAAVAAPGQLTRLLLSQNEALVRTTEVLHWWLFGTFLVLMYASFGVPGYIVGKKNRLGHPELQWERPA